jgi:RHS repeat-associated protein
VFTGHEREAAGEAADPLEGMDYMHARYYTFTLGRFMSVDPVSGEVGSSQSWNRYAYVRGNPVNMMDPWGLSEGDALGLRDMPVNLANAGPINAGFGGEITVTAKDPGWSPDAAYMYLVGLEYNDWLKSQGAGTRRGYADPYREMLRVAGGGRPYTDQPTFDDYMRWFGESYYKDMVNRGILSAGASGAIEGPLGISGSVTYSHNSVAGTIAMNTPVFGASAFAGAGVRFGSVNGPFRTRVVFTAANPIGLQVVYSSGISGGTQLEVLLGFGAGGSVLFVGSPVAVSW